MLLLPEPLPLGDLPPHLLCLHSREHLVPEALGTFPRVLHGLTATRLHLLLVLHPHVDGTLEKREALFLKVIVVLDMILGKDNIDAPGLLRAVDTTWGTIILVTRTATNKLGVETVAIVESSTAYKHTCARVFRVVIKSASILVLKIGIVPTLFHSIRLNTGILVYHKNVCT